eukprot:gene19393-biopygen19041
MYQTVSFFCYDIVLFAALQAPPEQKWSKMYSAREARRGMDFGTFFHRGENENRRAKRAGGIEFGGLCSLGYPGSAILTSIFRMGRGRGDPKVVCFSAPHQALALMWCCSSFEVEWVG